MKIEIRPMGEEDAQQIAAWCYRPPYSFYDADADADDLALLIGKKSRGGRYFLAFSRDALVGFFEFKSDGDDVVIGLGLRPDLTGRGLGLPFLEAGMAFARSGSDRTASACPSPPSTNARSACTSEPASSR